MSNNKLVELLMTLIMLLMIGKFRYKYVSLAQKGKQLGQPHCSDDHCYKHCSDEHYSADRYPDDHFSDTNCSDECCKCIHTAHYTIKVSLDNSFANMKNKNTLTSKLMHNLCLFEIFPCEFDHCWSNIAKSSIFS